MNNNDHINNIVTNAFQLVNYAYKHNNEAKEECQPLDANKALTRLMFPKNKKGNTRVSEQELRFAFVEVFNDYIKQHNLDWFYSIETPTEDKYSFSGGGQRNALFDLTICDASFKRIALIEFKAHTPRQKSYDKDIMKLSNPVEGDADTSRFFVQILENYDQGTLDSIMKKTADVQKTESALDINFRLYSILKDEEILIKP